MEIHGFQKMTLLDYPGKVACIVFLAGCDLRCPFCHNSELITASQTPPVMTDDELLTFLKKRQGLLEGVVITGGEPLLRKDLHDLLCRIRELDYPVKLDTNGTHPEQLRKVIRDGLVQYAAMDIKNSPEKYALTCGLEKMDIAPVRESVSFLLENRIDYEFRTTVVSELHDDSSFESIGPWIRGAVRYYLQPFADRETVRFSGFHAPDKEQLLHYQSIISPYVPQVMIRG